jgi:hypothetical protein
LKPELGGFDPEPNERPALLWPLFKPPEAYFELP